MPKCFDAQNFFQELTTGIDNLDNDIIFLKSTNGIQKRDIFKGKYIKVAIQQISNSFRDKPRNRYLGKIINKRVIKV